jgi:serine/threonine protein kinase
MVGVSNYMAPEFYLEDGYGYEVDIWAAAVCLYFMITGIYPFNLEDKSEE